MPLTNLLRAKPFNNIGIIRSYVVPTAGNLVDSAGGYHVGAIRYPNGIIYDLFVLAPANRRWGTPYRSTNGIGNTDITARAGYDGAYNTSLLIEDANYPGVAYTTGLSVNGFTDWYIPSAFELYTAFRNLKPTTENNSTTARNNNLLDITVDNRTPYDISGTFTGSATVPARTGLAAYQQTALSTFGNLCINTGFDTGFSSIRAAGYVLSSTVFVDPSTLQESTTLQYCIQFASTAFGSAVPPGSFQTYSKTSNVSLILPMRKVRRF